jgi:DNA-binding transcriptional LysR family regulator
VTLEQLRVFVAAAEAEHVTRAAQKLNLTQSAASAAIAALEERHGVRLFDRIGRRIALTAAGRAFLVEARAVLARAGAAERALADLAGLKTGELLLAASQTVGSYWLPQRLVAFRALYPGVSLKLRIGNTHDVATMTSAGEIDLGFVEGEVADPALAVEAVADDELVIVAAPQLRDWLSIAEPHALSQAPWVARELGSGTREAFEATLNTFGVAAAERKNILELPSNEAVRAAVEAGAGLAVLSRLVAEAALKAGALVASPLVLPRRRFFRLRHKQRYESLAARAFIAAADNLRGESIQPIPSSGGSSARLAISNSGAPGRRSRR